MMLCSWGGGSTDLLQQLEQTLPAHKVKCLLELSNGDHVHYGSLASEAALGFWVDALCEDLESD